MERHGNGLKFYTGKKETKVLFLYDIQIKKKKKKNEPEDLKGKKKKRLMLNFISNNDKTFW